MIQINEKTLEMAEFRARVIGGRIALEWIDPRESAPNGNCIQTQILLGPRATDDVVAACATITSPPAFFRSRLLTLAIVANVGILTTSLAHNAPGIWHHVVSLAGVLVSTFAIAALSTVSARAWKRGGK